MLQALAIALLSAFVLVQGKSVLYPFEFIRNWLYTSSEFEKERLTLKFIDELVTSFRRARNPNNS